MSPLILLFVAIVSYIFGYQLGKISKGDSVSFDYPEESLKGLDKNKK